MLSFKPTGVSTSGLYSHIPCPGYRPVNSDALAGLQYLFQTKEKIADCAWWSNIVSI